MSSRRTAKRFQSLLKEKGTEIPDESLPDVEVIFEAMIKEIQTQMEAQGLVVPADGFTYEDDDGTAVTEKEVQGESSTGKIPSGNFR